LVVPSASNWPLTISTAPVFINMTVPGLMVTMTLLWIVTVPCTRFVLDQVVFVVTGPETRFVAPRTPSGKRVANRQRAELFTGKKRMTHQYQRFHLSARRSPGALFSIAWAQEDTAA
jgi:hypothetical protein